MYRISPAQADDVTWLLAQLRDFDRFFGALHPLFPPDQQHAEVLLTTLIAEHPFLMAWEDGDTRVGFIAGSLAPHPYNPNLMLLSEMFWWVAPEHRGSRAGLLLLDAFIRVGRQTANWIVFTLEAKSPINPATLERRGFTLFERNYLLEV